MVWAKHMLVIDDVAVAKLFAAQTEETPAWKCFLDPSTVMAMHESLLGEHVHHNFLGSTCTAASANSKSIFHGSVPVCWMVSGLGGAMPKC